jgi:hypothetical protein
MTSLQAPVVATLSGVKSLDPVNKPVAAPASFTFVAGNTWKQQGTVNLKSTSNRGIGTGTATYTVNCGEKMRTMCANLGEALNPDTCQCECRTDLIVGGAPPNCQWKGTVKVTANVSGQMDMAALNCHEVWTLSYDATFTPVGLNNALINLGSSIQGRWRDDNVCTTQLARPCVATFATDDSISGAVPAIMVIQGAGSGVLELSITSTSGAFSPFGLTGTTTNTISDDICLQLWPPASSTEHRVPIQGFAGSGPATGTTFRGSSVNPIWGLPDGTQAAVTVSWDLQLVTMPVSP